MGNQEAKVLIHKGLHHKMQCMILRRSGKSKLPKRQAAFRGYLAHRAFWALKGIIRLQALIHGHLVRRQAIATLSSMLGIVKLHALGRGRQVRQSNIGLEAQTRCHVMPLSPVPVNNWVLCRIFLKKRGSNKNEEEQVQVQVCNVDQVATKPSITRPVFYDFMTKDRANLSLGLVPHIQAQVESHMSFLARQRA